ncbi:MAG: amidohydrolase [Gammaproteobacteria bacterium]|nr:MAG: amidohydrolase [Gammaproteobacteria bacterium]
MSIETIKNAVLEWVDHEQSVLSDWHQTIFSFGETAWREYQSCAWYVERLREAGFEVEESSAGMPTAFCAIWRNGAGPTIGAYAEYDAVPGNCQAADTRQRPRDGLGKHAGGHTDPHSALGISSLGAVLAARAAMEKFNIQGTIKYFGEPAEKVRGSKPIHAAAGYYDDLDAAISFHPFYMLPLCNTTRWNTHCGVGYAMIYSFECDNPQTWMSQSDENSSPIAASHASARAPGANDALMQMYMTSKLLKEHMVAAGCGWSMNECILSSGQATADNLPAQIAQIQYIMRVPTVEMAESITQLLDKNATAAAGTTHCSWRRDWVSKSRGGLPNHILAAATYRNLEQVGAPVFNTDAGRELAQQIQHNLGLEPMHNPFMAETEQLISPRQAEKILRRQLPDSQENFTSDDYTEFCWHAPTVRLYVARPALASPQPGYQYPAWVMNALGGMRATIDPMIVCAAKTIGLTIIDLLTDTEMLHEATEEFSRRTSGDQWQAPLCDYEPPIDFCWPEYVTDGKGQRRWCIPALPWEQSE